MKKVLAMLLALIMAGALFTACGGDDSDSSSAPPVSQAVSQTESDSSEAPTFETVKNINPFTGYEKAADYPDGKRAVAVMINNLKDALPQRGTTRADVLYEMVTEGGITRLMAVFSDYTKMTDTGPIRSARDQHIQLMFPYQAMYVHIGASTLAQDMLDRFSYEAQNMDGKYRDFWWMGTPHDKSSAYCYTNGELLTKFLQGNNAFDDNYEAAPIFNFVPYTDAPRVPEEGAADTVHIQFSKGYYADFTYDGDTSKYLKYDTLGQAQLDENDGRQVAVDNVIVLFTGVTKRPGDTTLFEVDYANGGYGYYMSQGHYEQIRWMKGLPNQPLRIVDMGGNEMDVQINCGKTYVAITDLETMFDQFTVNDVNPHNV